jgi:hypothetical protein
VKSLPKLASDSVQGSWLVKNAEVQNCVTEWNVLNQGAITNMKKNTAIADLKNLFLV